MVKPRMDHQGALHIPIALALAIFGVCSLLVLGTLKHWRSLAELQLRLDSCVGRTAIELRERVRSIESTNRRIIQLRAAILAASAAGQLQARAVAQTALEAQVLYQEGLLTLWRGEQARWILKRGCDGKKDLPWPLPSPPWIREPADPLGPKALSWPPGSDRRLRIQLSHSPRHAAAEIREELQNASTWTAHWDSPRGFPGANFH